MREKSVECAWKRHSTCDESKSGTQAFPQSFTIKRFKTLKGYRATQHWMFPMSEKKFLSTRRLPAMTPADTLSVDGSIGLRQKQARRPPAAAESNGHCPFDPA